MRARPTDHSNLALNTATLGHNLEGHGAGWSPEQVIDACAERGLGGIVFWRREIGCHAAVIGRRVREAGMEVVGLCRSPLLVGPLAARQREAVMTEFRTSIDMAAELGAPVLTIVTGGIEPDTRGLTASLRLVADRVAEAAPYAAASGVKLALEPLHPVYGGNRSCLVTMRDAVNLCQEIGYDNVGVAIDVYHVWWDGTLEAELKRAGASRIFGLHLCDWLATTTDIHLDRGMMGDGIADIKGLRTAVEMAGYCGFCEVEIFSADRWWKLDPHDVIDVCIERFDTDC